MSPAEAKAPAIRFWGAGTVRTLRPLWMAEELSLAYELMPIGPRTGETRTPEYAALTPKQKIPFMVDGDMRLSESLAICRYLLDAYPADGVWRPTSAAERAREDEWCCYIFGEIDETSLYVMRRHGDLGNVYGAAPEVVEAAAAYASLHLGVADQLLAGRASVMPGGFGVADIMLVSCLDWARGYGVDLPDGLTEYRAGIAKRPAFRRAMRINFA
jgi:glutathione S-transferase